MEGRTARVQCWTFLNEVFIHPGLRKVKLRQELGVDDEGMSVGSVTADKGGGHSAVW